ncbi:cation transporter [Campylobacter fetus]|uniref:Divalent metal cation transporter n=3 Tax=Campylobacter fetus TaxID=196 RepID=A0AAE6IWS6_CAMFE|nr:cation diffusion facilitator family transporter [Campylobacter fetus]OCS22445.1 cation transporter [Campylobacter fetus subsp. venerealis cfvi97/532]OCS26443.1 cation transporter [Campylobacter fetus subsp. venerealis cfvB10]OCS29840.1 cation transporter [Campylobacter fetus subsp. venerealis LMG 6570 = CCUG 33900]OCS42924.1 cation transporter [Campylobacter fetus subsp. venerealis cfvi02/298]ABK81916.1 cation efflux family protein [Campylobacter fetus subsp. fetus 82-40]
MQCVYGHITHKPLEQSCHDHASDHHRAHSHSHSSANTNKKVLKISLFITVAAMIFQFVYALITNSLALMSDTLHMLSHVIALGLSWFAIWAASSFSSEQKTFGYHRLETIAAFINSILIAVFGLFIVYEAIVKLINPEPIEIGTMLIVAAIGLGVNITTGLIMLKGDMGNLNIKSSFAHMMSDLLSSVAIILGGIIVYFTNLWWIDSALALFIAIIIAKWSFSLARDSMNILLEASPIDINAAKNVMLENPLVLDVHDLHISEITHKMYVLTAHIVLNKDNIFKFDEIINDLSLSLKNRLEIGHITIQPEWRES